MMPNKTGRHDAAALAQIVRTGWYKEVRIKSHEAYVVRALLAARHTLVGIRGRIENEFRGLLKTFGVMFGRNVGGFARRADEIIAGELSVSPELTIVIETLVDARRAILDRITVLDRRVYALAKKYRTARLFMTAQGSARSPPCLWPPPMTTSPARRARALISGLHLGATNPARSAATATKRGNRMTRTRLYEAATTQKKVG